MEEFWLDEGWKLWLFCHFDLNSTFLHNKIALNYQSFNVFWKSSFYQPLSTIRQLKNYHPTKFDQIPPFLFQLKLRPGEVYDPKVQPEYIFAYFFGGSKQQRFFVQFLFYATATIVLVLQFCSFLFFEAPNFVVSMDTMNFIHLIKLFFLWYVFFCSFILCDNSRQKNIWDT